MLLAATLVVFGLVAVYGASSLVRTPGGEVGAGFALRQLVGALVGVWWPWCWRDRTITPGSAPPGRCWG